jgi:hypothetical protein
MQEVAVTYLNVLSRDSSEDSNESHKREINQIFR